MRNTGRIYRKRRISKKIRGTSARPRLVVFRSHKHIYAQLVDDKNHKVITGASTLSPGFKKSNVSSADKKGAKEVGRFIAEAAKNKKVGTVRFDRGGYKFHGRVMSLAQGAREGGLKF